MLFNKVIRKQITISGKYAEDVNVIQKNNTLKIRMKLKKCLMAHKQTLKSTIQV